MLAQIDEVQCIDAIIGHGRDAITLVDQIADFQWHGINDTVDRRSQRNRIGRNHGVIGYDRELIGKDRVTTYTQNGRRGA